MLFAGSSVVLHSELSVGHQMALSVTFRFWGYVSCGTEASHVMNSDSNETIATTHHSTLRLDNIQERQQRQQTAQYNSGSFDTLCDAV